MQERECAWCGELFTPRNANNKFCSVRCLQMHKLDAYEKKADERRAEAAEPPPPPPEEKACVICGTRFVPKIAKQIYCGKECADEAVHRKYQKIREERQARVCVCRECGKEFSPRNRNQIYCSSTCCNRASRRETAEWRKVNTPEGPISAKVINTSVVHADDANRKREQERREASKRGRKRKAPRPGSLEWCVAEADRAGMSYGKFVAMLER